MTFISTDILNAMIKQSLYQSEMNGLLWQILYDPLVYMQFTFCQQRGYYIILFSCYFSEWKYLSIGSFYW